MTVHFTQVKEEDIETIAEIDRRAFAFPWSLNDFMGSFKAGHRFLVLRDGETIVGYALTQQVFEQAELLTIGVDPSCQRKGYGTLLMNRMLAELMTTGAEVLFLEVRVSNVAARGLYEKLGFVEIYRRKGYYPSEGGREDAIVMRKSLLENPSL